jgi:hypothetical protein
MEPSNHDSHNGLRDAAEVPPDEPPAEERTIPGWYRLFGDALIGVAAMVGATLWMGFSGDMSDLEKESNNLRDQQALYLPKESFLEQEKALAGQVEEVRKSVEGALTRWQESDDRFDDDMLRYQTDLRKTAHAMERDLSALRERLAPLEREARETGP